MLFEDFDAITPTEWKNLILKTIKADTDADKQAFYEKNLIRHPEPGLEVQPFYTAESLNELDYLKGFHRLWTQTRQTSGWMNVQTIAIENEEVANAQATRSLQKGADALWFTLLAQACAYDRLLDGLSLAQTPVYFSGLSYTEVLDFLSGTYDISTCMGGIVNPVDTQTAVFCQQTPYFRMLFQVDAQPEGLVDELVQMLQKALMFVETLPDAGLDIPAILPRIGFVTRMDSRYFLQIAKLRALRLLWWQIGKLHNPALNLVDVFVYAVVQAPSSPTHEPYKSLISNTTQAMSAIIGGCDALSVISALPTDANLGSRIARNVSVILKEESYLDAVTDLGAGSYLIENLTHQLAKAAWERLSVLVKGK